MRKRAVGLGLVLLAGLAFGACGSDEKRLSSAELATKGNAVCAKLENEVKTVGETFTGVTFTNAQMQDFYKKVVKLVNDAEASFKALTPPKDLQQVYDSALTQLEIDRKTLDGATASPTAAKKLFDTEVDPFTATNQKMAAAGITACRDNGAAGATGSGGTGSSTTTTPPTTAAGGGAATTTPTTTGR